MLRAALLSSIVLLAGHLLAQEPFQLPTANHALFEPGHEAEFLAPTSPDRPSTTGGFGCVRSDGWQMHEGLDIRSLQHDRHGEPTDPVMATADGTVCYFNTKPALSNYGKYIIIRHVVDGMEVYSLYAHLSEIQPGLTIGKSVRQGEVIGIMGRTSNTSERIGKERAHVHFELNLFINDKFASWYHDAFPGERNDHGIWNGQNLTGLDPRQILLEENQPGHHFNLLTFIRNQAELFRVQVRATNFPFLKRYPSLVLPNPATQSQGVAGYEIVFNYNGVPFALMPLTPSQLKGKGRVELLSVNEKEYHANPCRKYVSQRTGHWQLTNVGLRQVELVIY
jgi:murein DD-endopeptidase MepM/ murein hydrolase activator NlpD